MSSGSTQHQSHSPFRSIAVQGFLILGSMAAVFLAGTVRQGATGIFFLMAGTAMIFLAPNRLVPLRYWILSGGILVCASSSLLPQSWFSVPAWRLALQDFQVLPPLSLVTMVPRESGYWLIILASALLIGLFSIGHPLRSNVKIYLALLGTLGCGAYAGVALYAKMTGWEYPFFDKGMWAPPDFGFFPNRNHTASLLAMGSILALGVIREAWSTKKMGVFLLAGGALSLCVYSLLFHSTSRAGVVFLLVGAVIWVLTLGQRHRSIPLLVSSAAIAIALLIYFFTGDGGSKVRLLEMVGIQSKQVQVGSAEAAPPPAGESAFSDMRSKVFYDTARMIWDYPFTGTGLGSYAYVYPLYANKSIREAVALHPESDWLMIAAESGLPCLICVGLLLGFLLRDMRDLRGSPTWSLRWGIICGVLVGILHGLVDVPIHRVELGWWVLVLAGLAFGCPSAKRTERNPQWVVQRGIFAVGGGAVFILGVLLVGAQWFSLPPFPPYRAAAVLQEMRQLDFAQKTDDAINLARQEIPLSPMSRGLYRELSAYLLQNGGDPVEVDAIFDLERALNPVSAKLPHSQGNAWLARDPLRAAPLWGEALQKQVRIHNAGVYANVEEMFGNMLGAARSHPGLATALGVYARTSPATWLIWIARAPKGSIEEAAKDSEFLALLDPEGQRKFLTTWWNVGNRQAMADFIAANPSWAEAAWPIRVRQWIEKKDFQAAVLAAQERYVIDLSLSEPETSEDTSMNLAETVSSLALRGNLVTARRMIQESIQAREPEGLRLQCILAMKANDWASAWKSMEAYLRETKRGNLP